MSAQCFVDQIATVEILERVTKVCAECYDEIEVNDHIYYDMQSYRYLCHNCHTELVERLNDQCEVIEEEGGLFA